MKDRTTTMAFVALMAIAVASAVWNKMLVPPLSKTEEDARRQSLSRLRQRTLDVVVYMADNDHTFPADTSTLESALAGVAKPLSVERPLFSLNPASPVFAGNPTLGGKKEDQLTDPLHTVFFFDFKPWSNGERCISFVDGNAKRLPESAFQTGKTNDWVVPRKLLKGP